MEVTSSNRKTMLPDKDYATPSSVQTLVSSAQSTLQGEINSTNSNLATHELHMDPIVAAIIFGG